MDGNVIERVRADFAFLRERVLAVLVFGSSVDAAAAARDVDVCIVAPGATPSDLLLEVFDKVDVRGKRYDVSVFEELPIFMRHEVIEHHAVALAEDVPALGEYLYFQRKPCLDMLARQRQAV